jgi:HlyD family secretion protein
LNRKNKKIAGASVGVVIALTLAALALTPESVPVDAAELSRGELQVTLDDEGRTRVRERYVVSAPVAGRVLRVNLEPGDEVEGHRTVLATFEPAAPAPLDARRRNQAEARVEAARAALGQAAAERERVEKQLGFARSELERYRRLAAEGVVSRERFTETELEVKTLVEALEVAQLAVIRAEHELDAAKAGLLSAKVDENSTAPNGQDNIAIEAPVDGRVLRVLRESESVVPAGEPLLELGDPSDLEIVADFLSSDAVQMNPGAPVLIEQWGGGRPLEGRVRRVEPSGFTKISALGVEEQRVNVIIDFDDPHDAWSKLGDRYRVEVRVIVFQEENVVKVPTSSLFRSDGRWCVFAVENETARLRQIRIGRRNELEAEVLEGLKEGDSVILYPSEDVSDGTAIERR